MKAPLFLKGSIIFFNALSIALWLVLYKWYSLADHYQLNFFAFDKIPGHFSSPIIQGTSVIFAVLFLIYLGTYFYLKKYFSLPLFWLVMILAYICALINIHLYPVGALDVYNYIIGLKIFVFYNHNPYSISLLSYPNDPATGFAFFNGPYPYGPLSLFLSLLPTFFTGFSDTQRLLIGLKFLNLLLLTGITLSIYFFHNKQKEGLLGAFLFFANPLILFEAIGNVHNDTLVAFFLICAFLVLKKKPFFALPFLLLSSLVKFFTIPLLPILFIEAKRHLSKKTLLLSLFLSLLLLIIIVLPFWEGGKLIDWLLSGTTKAQSLSNVSLYSLVREYFQRNDATKETLTIIRYVFVGLFVVAIYCAGLAIKKKNTIIDVSLGLYLLFCILLTVLYSWYMIPVLALIALKPTTRGLYLLFSLTFLNLLSYPAAVWAWYDVGLPSLKLHLFLACFLLLPIIIYLLFELSRWAKRQ